MSVDDVRFDPARIIEVLERHGVDYVLVGGIAAQARGAIRTTNNLDCVPRSTIETCNVSLRRCARSGRACGSAA